MINSRQKGKRIERYFANTLKDIFPNIRRNAGIQAQSGGVDLEETGCFDFEVKGGKAYNIVKIRNMIDQVQEEGSDHNYKVVLVKPEREDPYAIIPYTDFLDLLNTLKVENII